MYSYKFASVSIQKGCINREGFLCYGELKMRKYTMKLLERETGPYYTWLCAHHRLMMKCMESVFQKDEGYKRIYIDLPGMGKSNAPDWINSSDHILEVLTMFIEEIIPKKDFY